MSLLERMRSAPQPALPQGAVIGQRWGPLARQRRTSIGLDFGAGALKVAQIRWTRNGPRLENFAIVPVPAGTLEEGAIRDPAGTGALLQATLTQMGVTQNQVGCCVGGPSILMRFITLPRVPAEEIRAAMKFEAPQHLPIPEDQLVFDFTPVPEAAGVPEHQMALFLAGTQKRLIDSFLGATTRAGLRATAVELDCLAALRTLQWTGAIPHTNQMHVVLVDFGETATSITVIRYGVPMISRTIPTGLMHLRTAVADSLQISMAEAEMALQNRGVQGDHELTPAVEPWLTGLIESVGRSVEFFLIQNRGANVERVYLLGGGATLEGINEALTVHLRKVLAARPGGGQMRVESVGLDGLDINHELLPGVQHLGPLLIPALGSALREGEPE